MEEVTYKEFFPQDYLSAPEYEQLSAANGQTIKTIKTLYKELIFKLGKIPVKFLVTPEVGSKIILGNDFLHLNEAQIDLR